MYTALIFNRGSGLSKIISASDFEREFAGNKYRNIVARLPEEREKLDIISEEYAVSMGFRRSYYYNAGEDVACASFVLPPGVGKREHLYEHDGEETVSLKEAVNSGKHILIRLNQKFVDRRAEFNAAAEPEGRTLKQWVGHVHGNFAAFSVNTATEVAQKLRQAKNYHEGPDKLSERIWFFHRGVILPYKHVVLDNNPEKLTQLYNHLGTQHGGVNFKSYHIGFPRFLRYIPTENQQGAHIFGNHIKMSVGKPLLTQLTCPTQGGKVNRAAYSALKEHIEPNRANGLWVLASPYVVPGSYDPKQTSIIRWDVNNQDTQLYAENGDKKTSRSCPKAFDSDSGPSALRGRVKPGIRNEPDASLRYHL